MKRAALIVLVLAVIGALFFFVLWEVEWRYPSGPEGKIQVHYTIAEKGPRGTEFASFSFWIAGHVETVQLIPIAYHIDGFVALYIKTTEGWYESPRATVASIDWKRGVKVEFHYPEGMKLRAQTSYVMRACYTAFGSGDLRWRKTIPPLEHFLAKGDIASILLRHQEDGIAVTVQRTTGGRRQAHGSGGAPSGVGIEVMMSGK